MFDVQKSSMISVVNETHFTLLFNCQFGVFICDVVSTGLFISIIAFFACNR